MDFTLSPEQLLIKDSVARFAAGAARGHRELAAVRRAGLARDRRARRAGRLRRPARDAAADGTVRPRPRRLAVRRASRARRHGPARRASARDLLEQLVEGKQRFAVAYEEPHARYDPARGRDHRRARRRRLRAARQQGARARPLDRDTLIVSARTGDEISLFAVPADAPGIAREPYASEDGYDVANLRLDGVRVEAAQLVGPLGGGLALLERGLDHATAALCAEGLGLMSLMLEATVEYTKQRQQFGVPIGSFQALQHRMAEMFIELELARSMAYLAAMTLDERRRRRRAPARHLGGEGAGRQLGPLRRPERDPAPRRHRHERGVQGRPLLQAHDDASSACSATPTTTCAATSPRASLLLPGDRDGGGLTAALPGFCATASRPM